MPDDLELLRAHEPFASLDPVELASLAPALEILVLEDGALVLEEGGPPADSLYVVRTGLVELMHEGEVVDSLGPGESFGFPSLISGDHPIFDVRAHGATTCLRIERGAAQRILGSAAGLRYVAVGLRDRAEHADRADPSGLVRSIRGASTSDDLVAIMSGSRSSLATLREGGLDAAAVAKASSTLVDAATRRAIDLAVAERGEPGAGWAWLAFGSVARREAGLSPDQDHTVVWRGPESLDATFALIAEDIVATLERAGLRRCPSDVMATSPTWRGPIDVWVERILAARGRKAMHAFLATVALDARAVAGPLSVGDDLVALRKGVRDGDLLVRAARLAVEVRPPIGRFGGLLTARDDEGRRTLDLKSGGVLPIVDLARVAAVRAGVTAVGTRARLRLAGRAGILGAEDVAGLVAAFDAFMELRLDRQIECLRAGRPLDARVEPTALDPVARSRLRQAFKVVAEVQERMHAELGGGRFG